MYKLCFFVPASHVEEVKSAIFLTGAGRVGDYENCCWQSLGTGQFKALSGSTPFVGKRGVLEQVEELKVELVCADDVIGDAVDALKRAHPYEEPAYDVWKLEDF